VVNLCCQPQAFDPLQKKSRTEEIPLQPGTKHPKIVTPRRSEGSAFHDPQAPKPRFSVKRNY
jgi:hypothetical protein